jgi:hypothetical protein
MLHWAVEILEAVSMKSQIDKYCMGLIDGDNLNTLGVKFEIGLGKNLLQSLN